MLNRLILTVAISAQLAIPETRDEEAIRALISAVNNARAHPDPAALGKMFTDRAELRAGGKLVATGPNGIAEELLKSGVWKEVTAPVIEIESAKVSSGTAVVEAVQVRYGSVVLVNRTPLTVWLVLTAGNWQISVIEFRGWTRGMNIVG